MTLTTPSKIIYVNQTQIDHPQIQSLLQDFSQHDWKNFKQSRIFDTGTQSLYTRFGKNTLPFRNDIIKKPNFVIPEYQPSFNKSFDEVTDQRCLDLRANYFDKPWRVFWSGGIDSTTIVTSILKNLSVEDLKNIKIVCNRISIYENPRFFYQHILPNFEIIDSSIIDTPADMLQDNYLIDGELADQLFAGGISQSMLLDSVDLAEKDLSDTGLLVDYIARSTGKECAEWYVNVTLENINSVSIPVQTYHDFFWWTFFNFSWVSVKMRTMQHQSVKSCKDYIEQYLHWFDHDQYQLWAMSANQRGLKYDQHPGDYKIAAKEYIYSFNKDQYYRYFKTKSHSDSRFVDRDTSWFCMLDDYTRLSLDHDLEQILHLLPDHVEQ